MPNGSKLETTQGNSRESAQAFSARTSAKVREPTRPEQRFGDKTL
jgi:hypothetical protein